MPESPNDINGFLNYLGVEVEQTNNSIDSFLKQLGVEVERPNEYEIRVMIYKLKNKYYINCFILGQATQDNLPGKRIKDQITFSRTTLQHLCEKLERTFDNKIAYHRDVPRGLLGPERTRVSYELLPPKIIPNNEFIKDIRDIRKEIINLYLENSKG